MENDVNCFFLYICFNKKLNLLNKYKNVEKIDYEIYDDSIIKFYGFPVSPQCSKEIKNILIKIWNKVNKIINDKDNISNDYKFGRTYDYKNRPKEYKEVYPYSPICKIYAVVECINIYDVKMLESLMSTTYQNDSRCKNKDFYSFGKEKIDAPFQCLYVVILKYMNLSKCNSNSKQIRKVLQKLHLLISFLKEFFQGVLVLCFLFVFYIFYFSY